LTISPKKKKLKGDIIAGKPLDVKLSCHNNSQITLRFRLESSRRFLKQWSTKGRPLSFHSKIEVGTNLDIYLSGNENPTLTFPQISDRGSLD
jgi:hypothetical protein